MNDVNQYLGPKKIHIFHDVAHRTWVCLQHTPRDKQPNKLKFLTPGQIGWLDFQNAKEKLVNEINAWLPHLKNPNPFQHFELPECGKSNDPTIQFLYVLMFAFGCALNVEESCMNPLGDETVEDVRKIVCSALSNGLEKEMPMIQAIWNASPEILMQIKV